MENIMTTTVMALFGLKTVVLAYLAKKYTIVNKDRVERRIK